jgi:hypothetical protein
MAPPKKRTSDDLLASIQAAADAEAAVEPPDTVEIDGVTYYRQQMAPAERKPDREGYSFLTVNLAPHASEIRIDGVIYFHGYTYEVKDAQLQTFYEIMHRTWQHERSTGGANIHAGGRVPFGSTRQLSPNGMTGVL